MKHGPDILVFSDLDGTLLGHSEYSWKPAKAALERLRKIGAGLVLATSKTAAEVLPIRADIGFSDWPAIVENGGGLLEPGRDMSRNPEVYREILARLRQLPHGFRGFGEMTAREVSEVTGMSLEAASAAKERLYSEPGYWTGSKPDLEEFILAVKQAGMAARRGGRFLTISQGGTKADRMDELIRRYKPGKTIALGDAPNDVEMLQKANYGVIVANHSAPSLPPLPGEASGQIRRTTKEGPAGWAEAVSALLEELRVIKDSRRHG